MAGSKKGRSRTSQQIAGQGSSAIISDSDQSLVNDLLTQLDSRDHVVQVESASILKTMHLDEKADIMESSLKQDSKSRFNTRQARKAAALAQSFTANDPEAEATLSKEANDEAEAIRKVCNAMNLGVFEVNPDGHCLFSAVADQLAFFGYLPPAQANYANVRAIAADFIRSHPEDFLPFLPSVGGEDTVEAHESGFMNPEQFESYCKSVRETAAWGGEPEIVALSRAFNIPIHVVQGGKPPVVVHSPSGGITNPTSPVVWLSYHRRLYGLGEHYNSLRPRRKV